MVGFPTDKNTIDARVGSLTMGLRDTLRQIGTVKVWLDSQSDANLTSLGYSAADITLLRASFVDLDKLRLISQAGATQASVSDFFFNAKQLVGVS